MRIAEFDRAQVLENAMQSFRAKGYAGTTMQSWLPPPDCILAASMPLLATSGACCWPRWITMFARNVLVGGR